MGGATAAARQRDQHSASGDAMKVKPDNIALRDWFAGMALPCLSRFVDADHIAGEAYRIANAMMLARVYVPKREYGRKQDEFDELALTVRSRNILDHAGITTMRQLTLKTEQDLLRLEGCGRYSVRNIKEAL